MYRIAIISSSVRMGRNSHRVALFFQNYLTQNGIAQVDMLDLKAFNFPLFEERLQYLKDPSLAVRDFADRIKKADGVLIVTPEYNGGYPAGLKNVIDLLYPEWKRKPVAIATASDGSFGGTQVMTSLVFSLWKIGALVVPAMYPGVKVQEAYDEGGKPTDEVTTNKRAKRFVDELMWCVKATK